MVMGFIKFIKFIIVVYYLFIGCYVRKIKNVGIIFELFWV